MAEFGELEEFNDRAVQGKLIKAYRNGHFDNPKTLFVQHHWTWDEFLCAASQRLEMVPMASRVFNADGAEIDDIMCIEENDMLFFSTGRSFKAPASTADEGSASSTDDKMAKVVGGYKVDALLGRGGFGEVRLGIHQLTSDRVALKFILKSEMGSLGDVERTTTEIQCLTALNHPSIIKLIRVINEPNHVVLVFELLEGGDMFHYLKNIEGSCLAEADGASVFTQILAGVGYAHNQHICHRDLKLENILLPNKNDITNVKIADFGLSDFYQPGAMMKTSCGSISYLAPEVFRGTSNAGPPLDVWSLGVILFAMVCGRLPFEGSDLHGSNRPRENVIRNRILRCQYKVDETLSPALIDLITKMLQPDPNERATIPELFSHPWVRNTSGGFSPESMPLASREKVDDDPEDEDSEVGMISTAKTPTMPHPTSAGSTTSAPGGSSEDDKLPSIVQRSPTRLDPLPPPHGMSAATPPHPIAGSTVAAIVPVGTPTSGRTRPSRAIEAQLQTKLSVARLDRASPRTSMGSGIGGALATTAKHSSGSSLSPTNASALKRNVSCVNSSTRSRQRPLPATAGTADKDKPHGERSPAVHAVEMMEKLPIAHQKTTATRRRSDHPGDDSSDQVHVKATPTHGLESIGKKSHGALLLPSAE